MIIISMKFVDSYLHYMPVYHKYIILVINILFYTHCIICIRLLTDFRLSAGPTDERYVTGGGGEVRAGVTLCDRGGGGSKSAQKSVT